MKKSGPKEKVRMMIDDFVESDYFQNKIKELRQRFNVPKEGLVLSAEDRDKIKEKSIFFRPNTYKFDRDTYRDMNIAVRTEISDMFPINPSQTSLFFKLYLLYGVCFYDILKIDMENLFKIVDLKNQYEELCWDENNPEIFLESQKNANAFYPVALRIHPYASQRDAIEYIKKTWGMVEYYQEEYKKKIKDTYKIEPKRFKSTAIKERNKFIYDNRDKSIKEIRKLLVTKKIFLDDGLIGKIISLEKKKRKEV